MGVAVGFDIGSLLSGIPVIGDVIEGGLDIGGAIADVSGMTAPDYPSLPADVGAYERSRLGSFGLDLGQYTFDPDTGVFSPPEGSGLDVYDPEDFFVRDGQMIGPGGVMGSIGEWETTEAFSDPWSPSATRRKRRRKRPSTRGTRVRWHYNQPGVIDRWTRSKAKARRGCRKMASAFRRAKGRKKVSFMSHGKRVTFFTGGKKRRKGKR